MTEEKSTEKSTQKDVESWELSDELWEKVEPLLPKPKSRFRGRGKKRRNVGGRPPAEQRKILAGILYVLRTGCQWNAAPKEFGSGKTLHRYFQCWARRGIFKKMWQAGLLEYDEAQGLEWEWQAADGAMTKAPLGGGATGPNPTDRGKGGTKRSLLVDGRGAPIGMVVSGANRHDSPLLGPTLDSIVVERPEPSAAEPQNLSLDNGYKGKPSEQQAQEHGYSLHLPAPTEGEKKDKKGKKGKKQSNWKSKQQVKREPGKKARRWVVEVAHAWINRFRRLLVRWEKKTRNYLSMLYFACAIICWRKAAV
jgi:putative transposase